MTGHTWSPGHSLRMPGIDRMMPKWKCCIVESWLRRSPWPRCWRVVALLSRCVTPQRKEEQARHPSGELRGLFYFQKFLDQDMEVHGKYDKTGFFLFFSFFLQLSLIRKNTGRTNVFILKPCLFFFKETVDSVLPKFRHPSLVN